MQQATIYANASVTKLREYSRSYGAAETTTVAYVIDLGNEIELLSNTAVLMQRLRKGTKKLLGFTGTVISERTFKMRTKKAQAAQAAADALRKAEGKAKHEAFEVRYDAQYEQWLEMLRANPDRAVRYRAEVESRPSNSSRSGNWRNWLRLKAAKSLCNGAFADMILSAPDLRHGLYNL